MKDRKEIQLTQFVERQKAQGTEPISDMYSNQIDHYIRKIENKPGHLPKNKKLIRDFLGVLDAKGNDGGKIRTKIRYLYTYDRLLDCIPDKKLYLLSANRKQLEAWVANINHLTGIGEETKTKIKICLKVLIKQYKGEGGLFTPPECAFIKTTVKPSTDRLTYDDLLTDDEVKRLIKNTLNTRDAAIIALMDDAPLRPHELIRFKRKHLNLEGKSPYIQVPENTKTGARVIPLVNCTPYLARYIETYRGLKGEEPLFLRELWNTERKPMTEAGLRAMLHKVAKRADVPKTKAYPYNFRHKFISNMATRCSNSTLEAIAGWTPNSRALQSYLHMNPDHVDAEVRRAYGIAPKEKDAPLKIQVKNCICGHENPDSANYCVKCGRAMSREIALMDQEKATMSRKMFIEFMKDPEIKKELKLYRKGKTT